MSIGDNSPFAQRLVPRRGFANNSTEMLLSDPGNLVSEQWLELPARFPSIILDKFVVMPNHFHGIIWTTDSLLSKPSLAEIVGSFKSIVTHKYIDGVNNKNWEPFNKRLWQRNYYERIVRNDRELQHIQQYIDNNPVNWQTDSLNTSSPHPNTPIPYY
jgi:putative transposase